MPTTSRTRQLFGVFSTLAAVLFFALIAGNVQAWLSENDILAAITTGLYVLLVGGLVAGILWGFLANSRAGHLYTRIGGALALVTALVGTGVLVPGVNSGAWDAVATGAVFLVVGLALGVFAVVVPRAVGRLQFIEE